MKKIILPVLSALALSLAAPAAYADGDPIGDFVQGGTPAANNHNHATLDFPVTESLEQQIAAVPVGGNWVGNHHTNTSNGNVINRG
ncbi:hypothetical protein OG944_04075 [Streptomyces anulatus]|uniref:hypothetical protein n=1 Tax=Streptomyces TaxID=1883 RepID=UPI000BFBF983|nr:hypothetical protein [Streptomyces sp. or3]WTC75282.1 hypothetical protein OG882_35060 [Streptomyces anulatus]WUD87331.1 hypothetical protein OG703_03950 [Streptomyces anulatus]